MPQQIIVNFRYCTLIDIYIFSLSSQCVMGCVRWHITIYSLIRSKSPPLESTWPPLFDSLTRQDKMRQNNQPLSWTKIHPHWDDMKQDGGDSGWGWGTCGHADVRAFLSLGKRSRVKVWKNDLHSFLSQTNYARIGTAGSCISLHFQR
jgi:hypothetical protein